MWEELKRQLKGKHIFYVFKLLFDSLSFQEQEGIMVSLINLLKPHLSHEVITKPARYYVSNYEDIIKAYVQSMDHMKSTFRSIL